ncbi:flagellar hook-associated protein FlgK [Methylobacillus gramineus]|uniref:flagellar hook-associated protein FlgK n=1 Tax=Methylobacillus gramineus TaxID=755169 RepID=UPI001CFFE16F|nr:flagellar hook-associated protein FlgK [Methylobacillus gramineus]MCB5183777.1 flagellar hook-associated protein FlgK [Methylobacillus gramineus]
MSSIFNIGKTALNAAQVGINVTGHNISNANTQGYSRQVIVQATAQAQNWGFGFIGQGTQIDTVKRVYNDLLAKQLNNSQSISSAINTQLSNINQINSMLADSNAGLSPAIQDFFKSINDLSSATNDPASRQAVISSGEALISRFQSLGERLQEMQSNVNAQLTTSVATVNTYAKEIARLNETIDAAMSSTGQPPNDLMDQRDQLVLQLNKEIKGTVVVQDGSKYNVFIGNGIPLVSGLKAYSLATINSPTDPSRLAVAYQSGGTTSLLSETSLQGGTIGGLLQYRSQSLDTSQNTLGQIAIGLAQSFNTQHQQGLTANGTPGGNFFNIPAPEVNGSSRNTGNAEVSSGIVNANALTTSDYRLRYDGSNYSVTRTSDGVSQSFTSLPQTVDGVSFSIDSGSMNSGDEFVIRPTANAATNMSMAISQIANIAAGAPVVAGTAASANTGSGAIGSVRVDSGYASAPLTTPFTLNYTGGNLSGFPAGQAITVTTASGSTTYPAGSSVPYTAGASISVAGLNFSISGAPANGDQFTVSANTSNASGDNRNALQLAALQTGKTMNNGTASYQDVFNQLVSFVGNRTRELQVTGAAEDELLKQTLTTQQSESGVNLDEEAVNLLRYQQAYQAAGKVMQIASTLFDTLLSIR